MSKSRLLCTHNYSGYEGRYCDTDIDGCRELECFEGVECMDNVAPAIGATCGPCPRGYQGDGVSCTGVCTLSHL